MRRDYGASLGAPTGRPGGHAAEPSSYVYSSFLSPPRTASPPPGVAAAAASAPPRPAWSTYFNNPGSDMLPGPHLRVGAHRRRPRESRASALEEEHRANVIRRQHMREEAEDAIWEYEQSNLTHRKRAQVNAGVHPFRFLIGDPAHPTSEATPVSYDKAVNGSVQEWREEQWRRQHAAQQQRLQFLMTIRHQEEVGKEEDSSKKIPSVHRSRGWSTQLRFRTIFLSNNIQSMPTHFLV